MLAPERYLTQQAAAALCGVSYDTIRRRRRAGGAFPGARRRPGDDAGTWEVPIADLIAAGLHRPGDVDGHGPVGPGGRSQVEHELEELRAELARAEERAAAQAELVGRQDEEIRFLRKLLVDSVGPNRRAA